MSDYSANDMIQISTPDVRATDRWANELIVKIERERTEVALELQHDRASLRDANAEIARLRAEVAALKAKALARPEPELLHDNCEKFIARLRAEVEEIRGANILNANALKAALAANEAMGREDYLNKQAIRVGGDAVRELNAEVARLTRERDEANSNAERYAADILRVMAQRDEARKSAEEWKGEAEQRLKTLKFEGHRADTLKALVAELERAAKALLDAPCESNGACKYRHAEDCEMLVAATRLRALLSPTPAPCPEPVADTRRSLPDGSTPSLASSGLTPDRIHRMKLARDAFRAAMDKPAPLPDLTFDADDPLPDMTPAPCATCGGSGSVTEFAWLVESLSLYPTSYLRYTGRNPPEFTTDPNAAQKFPAKWVAAKEARTVNASGWCSPVEAREHGFMHGPCPDCRKEEKK